MSRSSRALAVAVLVAAAAYVSVFQLGEGGVSALLGRPTFSEQHYNLNGYYSNGRQLAHDIYAYFYPHILYARECLRDGGRGLLWNPFQDCGEPFFGTSQTGLLYPPHLLFFLLAPNQALRVVPFINLLVAGLSMFLLCRELGAGTPAALAGALAFELGNATLLLTVWAFMVVGPYVWLPAALLFCERLLREPTARRAIALGVVLTMSLLPGYPQVTLFAYQLIGLRLLWEFATRRVHAPFRVVSLLALGIVLAPLLAAVQLVPSLEVGRESVRNAALQLSEMDPLGSLEWSRIVFSLVTRSTVMPFVLVPCLLAVAAFLRPTTRRHALFYLGAGALFFALAFGPRTPLFGLYVSLPLGRLFRFPDRFVWVTAFCLPVLTALGVDALVSWDPPLRPWRRWLGVALAALALAGIALAPWGRLRPPEWAFAGLALAAGVLAALAPGRRSWAAGGLVVAVALNLVAAPAHLWQCLLPDDSPLFAYRDAFRTLRARMTPQDRVYFNFSTPFATQFGLMQKTASVFRVPSIQDYEPQIARQYAEYFVRMREGHRMTSLNDVYYYVGGWMPPGFNQRLFDLVAGRYVVVAAPNDTTPKILDPPPQLIESFDGLRVYENPRSLPRARYVPRLDVVPDPDALLQRLAAGLDDPRRVALLEAPPPSGFLGVAGNESTGGVEFVRNDPEDLVLRVQAPARGFLFLADTHFPGWQATVDGHPSPILRANHAFRVVEVPAGESMVEFRYRPASILVGGAVSAATILALAVFLWRERRRR